MYIVHVHVQLRGGTRSLIFHVTRAHTNACHHGCVPHTVAVLKVKNCRIPKGSQVKLIV